MSPTSTTDAAPGVDIFGNAPNAMQLADLECMECKRKVASSRFAPHLEKCLGLGRTSGRLKKNRAPAPMSQHEQEMALLFGSDPESDEQDKSAATTPDNGKKRTLSSFEMA